MLPEPLHPAVVHFPIVFAVLLPFVALTALWMIRRGAQTRRTWVVPAILAMAVTASGWVALQTGEAEEDRVENVVGEAAIHEHEEAAERFLLVSGIVTLVALGGLASGTVGSAARFVAAAGSILVLAAGALVGARGGELVYEHGAAQAYVSETGASGVPAYEREEHERDEH